MSLNTTPRTWVAGETITAAELNTEVRDAVNGLQSAWTAYTPTLTGITLGNGTVAGHYFRQGQTIHVRVKFTAGSSTTFSGTFTASLPAAPAGDYATNDAIGAATLDDASASIASRTSATAAVTGSAVFLIVAGAVTDSYPWTWAAGDTFSFTATYEAA